MKSPSNEEVAREAHVVDDGDLAFQARFVIRLREPPVRLDGGGMKPPARVETIPHDLLEVALDGGADRHIESRQLETFTV